jgi:hypothetical protein
MLLRKACSEVEMRISEERKKSEIAELKKSRSFL